MRGLWFISPLSKSSLLLNSLLNQDLGQQLRQVFKMATSVLVALLTAIPGPYLLLLVGHCFLTLR